MSSLASPLPLQPVHRRLTAWLLALLITLPVGWLMAAQRNDAAATQLLASELPAGVTLASANADQMVAAVRSAVRSEPKMTAGIVRVAIVTKVPTSSRRPSPRPRRPREGKNVTENEIQIPESWRNGVFIAQVTISDPCSYATRILNAVRDVAPDRYPEALEVASQLLPNCDFSEGGGGGGGTPGGGGAFNDGFGFGFGPGFVGSAPGGAVVTEPPAQPPITPVRNQ